MKLPLAVLPVLGLFSGCQKQVGKEKFKQFNSLLAKEFEFTSVTQTDK